tara:strand:+ start:166 stop:1299 length:1134 start_codon:yes stop_codon:yes gene_type:complete
MKITLISVFPPYRGGISAHSSLLYKHLVSNEYDVQAINYSKQYPDFLFPGKNQFEELNIQKDISSESLINSISPRTWIKTARKIITYNPDVVIFRFWNPFFSICLGFIARYLKKKNFSKPLLSICDNIIPHENFFGAKFLTQFYLKYIDGFIVQSEVVKNELLSLKPSARVVKRFHPIYNNYGKKYNKELARKDLQIKSKNIILFFGIIRKYKGLDVLIESIPLLKKRLNDFHVLVVGECYENIDKYKLLIQKHNIEDFVTITDRYVPDNKISTYFSASDVVVLPYKTASQSGIIQIAYNFDVPIITTNVGGLGEYINDGLTGFLIDSNNPKQLAEVLYDSFNNNCFENLSINIKDYKRQFSWDHFINGIDDVIVDL